jgi:hypothetical protein
MLAFLYRQTRKFELSNAAWVAAKMAAEARGDSFAVVRLDRIGTPRKHDPTTTGDTDLIGASTPLPPGGGNLETAPVVPQGLYLCTARHYGYLKIWLKGGQQLFIHFRQADDPNGADLTAIVHDTNGERKALGQVLYNRPSGIASVEWTAPATGWHFVQIAAQANSVFRVTVRD